MGSSPRIKIYFFLLSACTENFISTPKINTLQPNPPQGNEKVPLLLNPMPYPDYLYLSISAFLVNLNASNKQFSKVG